MSAKVFPPPQDGATGVTAGWLSFSIDSGFDETLDLSSALESSVSIVDFDTLDEGPSPPVDSGSFSAFPSGSTAAIVVVAIFYQEDILCDEKTERDTTKR